MTFGHVDLQQPCPFNVDVIREHYQKVDQTRASQRILTSTVRQRGPVLASTTRTTVVIIWSPDFQDNRSFITVSQSCPTYTRAKYCCRPFSGVKGRRPLRSWYTTSKSRSLLSSGHKTLTFISSYSSSPHTVSSCSPRVINMLSQVLVDGHVLRLLATTLPALSTQSAQGHMLAMFLEGLEKLFRKSLVTLGSAAGGPLVVCQSLARKLSLYMYKTRPLRAIFWGQ
jgi:hypothetical protein